MTELTKELQTLRDESETRAEQVRIAQESAFRNMDTGKWAPLEDTAIRAELKKIEAGIRHWAKTYAFEDCSIVQNLPCDRIAWIVNELREIGLSEQDFAAIVNGWKNKAPLLLIQAIVSKNLIYSNFHRPFHFLRGVSQTGTEYTNGVRSESPFAIDMQNLYDDLRLVDERQAHFWRSGTLRQLSASGPIADDVVAMRDDASNRLAWRIIDGPLSLMLRGVGKEESRKRYESLASLFSTAIKISARLWTQRTHMRVGHENRFKVDSSITVAHRLQKLDEGDTRLDGKNILAVIQPAVVAYGTSTGEDYENRRVWLKSIVLVEE
ncbi:predicted protein [Uncinocarpus reesii 1704]|uniref:Uncharacterized protein n=1 Tax=Uncinocarpus reesii (strain UAMH 1704) TaxID=336963 RepID=C4JW24_UNCRE|nr:uncharacterized protein UREG_06766 [Uncinocarpus reesii 1704]EEP81901.1 predicted protein [Uncinocarpus reesii 1704]